MSKPLHRLSHLSGDTMKPISAFDKGCYRVLRGGSWFYTPSAARVAIRLRITPGNRDSLLGFRPICGVR